MGARPLHLVSRGDVWWCDFEGIPRRPVVVMSRDQAIARRGRCIVAPCTTHLRGLPSEVRLEPGEDSVPKVCAVNLDAVTEVSVAQLTERFGRLSSSRMAQLCDALAVAVDSGS